jgi:hypothetical protein
VKPVGYLLNLRFEMKQTVFSRPIKIQNLNWLKWSHPIESNPHVMRWLIMCYLGTQMFAVNLEMSAVNLEMSAGNQLTLVESNAVNAGMLDLNDVSPTLFPLLRAHWMFWNL